MSLHSLTGIALLYHTHIGTASHLRSPDTAATTRVTREFFLAASIGTGVARVTVLGKTVHTHCASVHQAAKLVAALLRVARVTAGLAESNGSLPPGL